MGEHRRLIVAIVGGSGMIGSALADELGARGHEVRVLTRGPGTPPRGVHWDAAAPEPRLFDALDAVVNLAGSTIATRWTLEARRRIADSRVDLTQRLVRTMARCGRAPRALISASAIGWYGDRGDETLDESSRPGSGFLADLTQRWEQAACGASSLGVRVVRPRIGLVLSTRGGVLERLVPLFRLGLGGPIASGRMWWSWITLDDVVGVLVRAIEDPALEGAINTVSPTPVRMNECAAALGRVLSRRAWLPAPAFALRFAFGQMADEVLLAGQRVIPRRLLDSGHTFRHVNLEAALRDVLLRRA